MRDLLTARALPRYFTLWLSMLHARGSEVSHDRIHRRLHLRRCPPRDPSRARSKLPMSMPLVRQHRERGAFDAFVDKRARLVRRGLAVDRAMFDIAVMHLARFVGEALADIVGILYDVIAQFLELDAQFALLRHQQRRRFGRRRRFRRRGRRWRSGLAALLGHDLRSHDGALDLDRAAVGAAHQLALFLALIGRGALKPAFERMALLAAKVVADHAEPRTRCRCSGPALGSAMPKRLPCCSDGTLLRAASTFDVSISARKTPGSAPPSARISPQGAMISEWP